MNSQVKNLTTKSILEKVSKSFPDNGQKNLEGAAAAHLGAHMDVTAVGFDNAP